MQTAALLTPPTLQGKALSTAREKLLTGDEAFGLGIDQPFDLVNGRIVTVDYIEDYTGDEHGIIESEIARLERVVCRLTIEYFNDDVG